ncbi:MAG: patatin-like protein, partial [Chloroflexi bacterium]
EAAGGEDVNDFEAKNSPFLAFAARCTSAFPFASEPMRLADVKDVVEAPYFRTNYNYDPSLWKGFYKDYLQTDDSAQVGTGFEKRSFGDGGYLDNKPFSYVTETLLRRRADLPVDRKLIYIEPAPEHPTGKDFDVRPDALQNVAAALLTLPRYETIREDLGLIMERNKMIERVGAIMKHIRHASRATLSKHVKAWQLEGPEWAKHYLDEQVLGWYGPGYAAYHQLRVASLLDDLASGFVRAMGIDENSEQASSFRQDAMEGWRQAYYRIDPNSKDERKSENDLLFRLDIGWRIRRLQFMQSLIDDLLDGLSEAAPGTDPKTYLEAQTQAREIVRDSKGKESDWPLDGKNEGTGKARSAYRHMLLRAKARFNDAYKDLRAGGRLLRSRSILASIEKGGEKGIEDANLQAYGEQLKALKEAVEGGTDDDTVYARLESLSTALASGEAHPQPPQVKGAVRAMLSANSALCKQILGQQKPAPPEMLEQFIQETARSENLSPSDMKAALSQVQACLEYYYNRYEYYDMLTFPLFFGTEVGESDVVEIIRISPEDAPSLRPGSQKLAGTKLGNFGAFFVRGWRENDILWGRLDGAECLINALLPGDEHAATRATLTSEAHQDILQETFLGADQKELFEALKLGRSGEPVDANEVKAVMVRALGGASGILDRFRRDYRVDLDFPPDTTLKISARASRVTGKLLAELSSKYPAALASPAGMIARLGQIFNGLVQVALPQSLPNLIFNSLVWLLYPIELLLALGGRVFGLPDVSILGAIALGITIAAHLGV